MADDDAPPRPQRSNTPTRSGPAPIRLLRVCLDNLVLGGVEVSETSTLADVRESIMEDEIQGVPANFLFLFSGAPVTRRQETRRRALVCFPFGFLTIIPEDARIEQPSHEAGIDGSAAAVPSTPQVSQPVVSEADATPVASGGEPAFGEVSHVGITPPTVAHVAPPGDVSSSPGAGGDIALELHITDGPLEGTTVTVGEEGAQVGRHTSNTLVIPEAGISRYHCEIRYVDGGFCVRDLGSVTGTYFYLKPHGHFQMFAGLMVKLGETEFQVLSQTAPSANSCEQVVLFFEGPYAGHKVYIPSSGITIGRRHDNNLVLTPDATVSAHHAAIFSEEGEYYLSDLGSCNGTCIRLSAERTDSDWHPIMDGDVLGAGCTKILCRITNDSRSGQ